ncbi:UNVERIFIED_CONTAM: DNA-binding NarL/FixJ family response regulator [Acetivibrio alkalicellulosi]
MNNIKIMIVDDQKLFRDCLKYMIEANSEFEISATASNGNEAIEIVSRLKPDVILMDIMMPVCDGITATKVIKQQHPGIKVIILTTSESDKNLHEAIENGAEGYVLKNTSSEQLIMAIKSVLAGMEIIQKQAVKSKSDSIDQVKKESGEFYIEGVKVKLTDRELLILKMIGQGKSNAQIAGTLFLSEGRVRNIVTELVSKIMVKDRTQLAIFAIRNLEQ